MSTPGERQYYRIQYPMAVRPQIVVDGRSFEVIDLSERGVRFRAEEGASFSVGDEIAGSVHLRRPDAIEVRGRVVRLTARDVAAQLEVGVPLRVIIEEQRFVREHHRGMTL